MVDVLCERYGPSGIAALIGVSDSLVSLMRHGKRKPGRDLAARMSKHLEIPMEWWS